MPHATYRKCIIPGCRDVPTKSVTLFRFPKDVNKRKKWIDFVKSHVNEGEPRISTGSRLCSQHFTKESFENFRRRELGFTDCPLLLVPGAEPNVVLARHIPPPDPPTVGAGSDPWNCSTSPPRSTLPTPVKLECQCGVVQKVTREVGCQTDSVVEKRTVATQLSEGTLCNKSNTELLQQQFLKEEEGEEEKVVADQQLCIQEGTSSLDQQDPAPLQIKEEPEEVCTSQGGEQFEVKEESYTLLLAPYEESDHSQDQTLSFRTHEAEIVVEEKPLSGILVMNSVKSEANTDHQLLSHSLQEGESRDQIEGRHGESGSARNTVQKLKKRRRGYHTNNLNNSNLESDSEISLDTRTSQRPFKCDSCGKDFRFKSFWLRHQRVHANLDRCVCKICGRTLYDTSALKKHIRIHTGEKPYSCEVCGRDFRYSGGLEVHMRIHRGEKPFPCKTCGKRFRCLSVLKAHVKTHTGERPYACKTCDKSFCEMSALKRHTRSHTGEKPYNCKICGRDFRYSSGFQGHMKRAHAGEVKTP